MRWFHPRAVSHLELGGRVRYFVRSVVLTPPR
jgi:hypothetical protein